MTEQPDLDTQPELILESLEAEELVIGCAFMNATRIPPMRAILTEGGKEFFYVKLGWVWAAILSLYDRGDTIDPYTVGHELDNRGQFDSELDPNKLFWLSQRALSYSAGSAGAETYAGIVARLGIKRTILGAATSMVNSLKAPGATSIEIIKTARTELDNVTRRVQVSQNIIDGDVLAGDAMDEFQSWQDDPRAVRGLSCGIHSIDAMIGGFQTGTVTGILAQTSMGKSTLATCFVRAFANDGPGLFVPTETPGRMAMHKMALDMTGIPLKAARAGQLSEKEREAAYNAYAQLIALSYNIKLVDESSPSMESIYAKVMQMQAGAGCGWLVLDSGSKFAKSIRGAQAGDNLYKATTIASGFLQDIARMGIAVVSTWQIGRSTKERGTKDGTGKEPTLHDAKDSGAIEEDVDILFGLYRHEYFVKRQMAQPDEARYPQGTAKLSLLKDRAGTEGDDSTTLGFKPGRGFFDITTQKINLNDYQPF